MLLSRHLKAGSPLISVDSSSTFPELLTEDSLTYPELIFSKVNPWLTMLSSQILHHMVSQICPEYSNKCCGVACYNITLVCVHVCVFLLFALSTVGPPSKRRRLSKEKEEVMYSHVVNEKMQLKDTWSSSISTICCLRV